MPDLTLPIQATSVAAAITAISLLVCGWPWRSPKRSRLILGWTLGLGVGFFAGCIVLDKTFHWPLVGIQFSPKAEGKDRLLYLLLPAAMLVECLSAFLRIPRIVIWLLRMVIAGSLAKIMLHNSIYLKASPYPDGSEWNLQQQLQFFSMIGGSLFFVWLTLDLFIRKIPSRTLPLVMSLVCVASAVTIILSGSLSGGQLALPLAGALAGGFLVSFVMPISRDGSGLLGVSLVVLFGLLVEGHFFAKLTTVHAAILSLSLVLVWLPEIPPIRNLSTRIKGPLRVLLVAIPVAFVLFQAYAKFEEESKTSSQPGEPTTEDYGNFNQ